MEREGERGDLSPGLPLSDPGRLPTPLHSSQPQGQQGQQGGGQNANEGHGEDEDLDPSMSMPENKKEVNDWLAVFNSRIRRSLDVDLVHTLCHERCVRLSRSVCDRALLFCFVFGFVICTAISSYRSIDIYSC